MQGIQQKHRNATFASLSRTEQHSLSSLKQSRQNTHSPTAPPLSRTTNDGGTVVLLTGREFVRSQEVTCPLCSGSALHPNPCAFQSYNISGFSQHKHVTARGTVIVFAHAIGLNMALFELFKKKKSFIITLEPKECSL